MDASDVYVLAGEVLGGAVPTYTLATTGLQNTARSYFGIFRKVVIFHEIRVRTQSQDL